MERKRALNARVSMNQSHTQRYTGHDRITNVINGNVKTDLTTASMQLVSTRNGTAVPNWQKRIASLSSATSAYVRNDALRLETPTYKFRVVWNGGSKDSPMIRDESWEGNINFLLIPTKVGSSSRARNTALGNFLSSAASSLSKLQGGTLIGELRETLQMIKKPASSLRDSLEKYYRRARGLSLDGYIKRRHRLHNSLTDMYLEYTYGWRPLMNDIAAGADAYMAMKYRYETERAEGSAKDVPYSSIVSVPGGKINMLLVDWKRRSTSEFKSRYVGVARSYVGVHTDTASEVRKLCGFQWQDFLPTAWNLLPYSFVADYFSNIGDILNSAHGLTADWIWKSYSVKCTYTLEITPRLRKPVGDRILSFYENGVSGKVTRTDYSRGEASLYLPTLQLEIPAVGFVWANLAALCKQGLSSKRD